MRLIKILSIVLILFGLIILISSCATQKNKIVEKDIPDWYLNPPKVEDAIYGVGSAKMSTLQLSRTFAISRARDDIARQVKSIVKSVIIDYAQEAGAGKNDQTLNFAENISKQIADVSLENTRVIKVEVGKDGTVYALVEYQTKQFQELASNEFKRNENAAFAEFKAREAEKRLEEELSKENTRTTNDSTGNSSSKSNN